MSKDAIAAPVKETKTPAQQREDDKQMLEGMEEVLDRIKHITMHEHQFAARLVTLKAKMETPKGLTKKEQELYDTLISFNDNAREYVAMLAF